MNVDLSEVLRHVELYFSKHLSGYTVQTVTRKSFHPYDDYLYVVTAKRKKDGSFAVWTSWNESTQSLNHGHYGIQSLEDCEKLVKEYTNETRYFAVYRCSHKVREILTVTESEGEARQFCEDNHYEWKDENDFLWSLEYGKV